MGKLELYSSQHGKSTSMLLVWCANLRGCRLVVDGVWRVRWMIAELQANFGHPIPHIEDAKRIMKILGWSSYGRGQNWLARARPKLIGAAWEALSCQHHALYLFFWQTLFSNRCLTIPRNLSRSRPCFIVILTCASVVLTCVNSKCFMKQQIGRPCSCIAFPPLRALAF